MSTIQYFLIMNYYISPVKVCYLVFAKDIKNTSKIKSSHCTQKESKQLTKLNVKESFRTNA